MRRAPRPRGWILVALAVALAMVHTGAPPVAAAPRATRVELTAAADAEAALALLRSLGATVELRSGDRIQAQVPAAALPALRRAQGLVRMERPAFAVPLQIVSTTALIGADRWQAAGLSGHGVKFAVLDTGFAGYEGSLGGALPGQVIARSFRADRSMDGAGDHGRRAAEVASRIAPGAALYLVAFSTVTELSAAVDYLIAERVDVVSFSLGYVHNGPGDGTGSVARIVTRATDAGIAWAVAAGNWAQQHWSGSFRDDNRDAVHEFRPGVQQLTHAFSAGDLITFSVRWDDPWGAACSDYDLELFGPDGSLVSASRDVQSCDGDPVEDLQVLATQGGAYAVRVVRANAATATRLDVVVIGSPDRAAPLSIFVPAGSLAVPADHPAVVTVGALTTALVRSEAPYSSRGPTTDGRAKPNILAPAGLGGSVAGEAFAGTSAAAPDVAGAMALIKEAIPGLDRDRLAAELQARAVAVAAVQDGTSAVRRLDLGGTTGLGPLLPPGSGRAVLDGQPPQGAGIAVFTYHGPADYPLRFLHSLLGGREVAGAWMQDAGSGRWRGFVTGAPSAVNGVDRLADGDAVLVVLR